MSKYRKILPAVVSDHCNVPEEQPHNNYFSTPLKIVPPPSFQPPPLLFAINAVSTPVVGPCQYIVTGCSPPTPVVFGNANKEKVVVNEKPNENNALLNMDAFLGLSVDLNTDDIDFERSTSQFPLSEDLVEKDLSLFGYSALSEPEFTNIKPVTPDYDQYSLEDLPFLGSTMDFEQLAIFIEKFKKRRVLLGLTQADVSQALSKIYNKNFSQTTICRFELAQLSLGIMNNICSFLVEFVRVVERKVGKKGIEAWNTSLFRKTQTKKKKLCLKKDARKTLEEHFQVNMKPETEDLDMIAKPLGLSREFVRMWFNNRRQKRKKELKKEGYGVFNIGDSEIIVTKECMEQNNFSIDICNKPP